MENLKVRENGPMSWDFTKPGGGYQDNQVEDIFAFSMLSNLCCQILDFKSNIAGFWSSTCDSERPRHARTRAWRHDG